MKGGGQRLRMILSWAEAPHGWMIGARGLPAQVQQLIDADRGRILVRGRWRGQEKISLWRYAHVIPVVGQQRIAQRISPRLDELFAVVFRGIGKPYRGDERALRKLRVDYSQRLRGVRFCRHRFAQPDVAHRTARTGDPNAAGRERLANWRRQILRRSLTERLGLVALCCRVTSAQTKRQKAAEQEASQSHHSHSHAPRKHSGGAHLSKNSHFLR